LLTTGVLTFVLSMDTVFRLINLIVDRGVKLSSVSLMLLYRTPQFLSVTIPIATGLAVVLVVVRLSLDHELTALRASGYSYGQLGRIATGFGLLTTALGLLITLVLQPLGYRAFEDEKLRILKSHTAKTIKPQVWNYDFSGKVLFIEALGANDQLQGVFVSDHPMGKDGSVTVASSGSVDFLKEEQAIVLHLQEGAIHRYSPTGGYQTVTFDQFRYVFAPPKIVSNAESGHIWGVPTPELWQGNDRTSRVELLLRLTNPLAGLALAAGMVSLSIISPRRYRTGAYLRAFILVVVYYLTWVAATEMATYTDTSELVLGVPALAVLTFGILNLLRMDGLGPR
jgi:lipopolysaccharide export system permease protein